MRRVRVFPTLLLHQRGLVKSRQFSDYQYVGDPINAVRIFTEMEVDEICILDVDASKSGHAPNLKQIAELAGEAFVPMSYGGGITTVQQMKDILYQGVEKVVLNTAALQTPELIRQGAEAFGSSSVVVSMDVKRARRGGYKVFSASGARVHERDPVRYAQKVEALGAGEILLQSVDGDGTLAGLDIELVRRVSHAVGIPVVASGGARDLFDLRLAVERGGASAVSAGALFVFNGPHRAVLINFPRQPELEETFAGL